MYWKRALWLLIAGMLPAFEVGAAGFRSPDSAAVQEPSSSVGQDTPATDAAAGGNESAMPPAAGVAASELTAAPRGAPPTVGAPSISADLLLRTDDGRLIPLSGLLGPKAIADLLKRGQDQLNMALWSIAQLALTGHVDRDVVTLTVTMQVQVRPEMEWVTVPFNPGDVYVTGFAHTGEQPSLRGVLESGDRNARQWRLSGRGLHTLTMHMIGKARTTSPGISQFQMNLPAATASHAELTFAAPVDIQSLPAGAVDKLTRDERGVTSVELWGVQGMAALTWSEVAAPVTRRPLVQVENRLRLDLTTIPVALTGNQVIQVSGSPVSELQLTFPEGFQLQEVDARNSAGISILNNFEVTSESGPVTAIVRLTAPTQGQLSLSFDLELLNRAFPQDIRVALPSVQDANVQSGDLDIVFPTGLLVQQTRVQGVQRKRVAGETDLTTAATAFRMRSTDSEVVLHVEETEAQFAVSPELTVQPQNQNVLLTARYPISVLQGALLGLEIEWPGFSGGDWQVLPGQSRLITDKGSRPLSLQQSDSVADLLQVAFPERQSGDFTIEFKAFASLEAVRSGTVQLLCPELKLRRGQPFVLKTIESDEYSVRPISMGTGNLLPAVPLPTAAADPIASGLKTETWLQQDPSIPVRLELPAQAPAVRAKIELGLVPRPNGIQVSERIWFEIEHRDLTTLALRIAPGIQPTVRVAGTVEPLRAAIDTESSWNFRLPEARRGSLDVEISYLWSSGTGSAAVGTLRAAAPSGQSGAGLPVDVGPPLTVSLPIVLPESAEISVIEAGTSDASGLAVADHPEWMPVFSSRYDSAWQRAGATDVLPLQILGPLTASGAGPDLILVRTQLLGGQIITSTMAMFETAPEVVTFEMASDIGLEGILLNGESLTAPGSAQRQRVQARAVDGDRRIQWMVAVPESLQVSGQPLSLLVQMRQRAEDDSALASKRSFSRAVWSNESAVTPVIWYLSTGDTWRAVRASDPFRMLTKGVSLPLPGVETPASRADRGLTAALSLYSPGVREQVQEDVNQWLSVPGREDMFFGVAEPGVLKVQLVSGSVLLLVTAVSCAILFAVLSVVGSRSPAVSLIVMACGAATAWLLAPEWTGLLLPYVLTGAALAMVCVLLQWIASGRRMQWTGMRTPDVVPEMFGLTGILAPSVVLRPRSEVRGTRMPAESAAGQSG
jgi:hypothetical protein